MKRPQLVKDETGVQLYTDEQIIGMTDEELLAVVCDGDAFRGDRVRAQWETNARDLHNAREYLKTRTGEPPPQKDWRDKNFSIVLFTFIISALGFGYAMVLYSPFD